MLTLWFCLLASMDVPSMSLQTVLKLEDIPDSAEEILQRPSDVALDEAGNFYVLDLTSRKLFVWNADGSYKTSFGRAGQGPGEFNFRASMGGLQGYVNVHDDEIFVYDGGSRTVNVFGPDYAYKDSIKFNIPNGRAEQFRILNDGRFLVFNSSYTSEEPYRQIGIYARDATLINSFIKAPDQTWHYVGKERNGVVLHIYSPALFMHYDSASDRIIIGNSAQPKFSVYEPGGKTLADVSMSLPKLEVTQEDIEEYEGQDWIKGSNFFQTSYPDEKAFYDKVLPAGDGGYLVFLQSPVLRRCEGFYVDKEGRRLGRFKQNCGQGGSLNGSRGKIIMIYTDEAGDYTIAQVKPGEA